MWLALADTRSSDEALIAIAQHNAIDDSRLVPRCIYIQRHGWYRGNEPTFVDLDSDKFMVVDVSLSRGAT